MRKTQDSRQKTVDSRQKTVDSRQNSNCRWRLAFCLLSSVFCLLVYPCRALEPDQLLLITNKNAPQEKKLAEFYAEKRHVPAGRILELDLAPSENIPSD